DQGHGIHVAQLGLEGEQQQIEPTLGQLPDDVGGAALAQEQPQVGEGLANCGHGGGQEVGGDGGDDPQAQGAGELVAAPVGGLHHLVGGGQGSAGQAQHLLALGGDQHAPPV